MPPANSLAERHEFQSDKEMALLGTTSPVALFTACRPYLIAFTIALLLISVWSFLRAG
jgi:hypothetical protein